MIRFQEASLMKCNTITSRYSGQVTVFPDHVTKIGKVHAVNEVIKQEEKTPANKNTLNGLIRIQD